MFAGPPIVEVPFVLVLIHELDFSHVIETAVAECTSLTNSILRHS